MRLEKRSVCLFLILWIVQVALAGGAIRVASYNVQNYLAMDRTVSGRFMKEYPKPEEEKTALREIIREVNPDILLLQEIGGWGYLRELRADLKAEGLDYPYLYLGRGEDTVRYVALLSRIKPRYVKVHDDITFSYNGEKMGSRRGLLEAGFGEGERAWVLFGLHLKSRWTERADDPLAKTFRTREAQAIRERIRQRCAPESRPRFLIAGDFNDHKNSPPLRRFLRAGETELARLLPVWDSRGEVWTFFWEKEDRYERVDFFLVSPELEDAVVGGHGRIADMSDSFKASDHRMIYLDLEND